jgi:hypothetical protein
VTRLDAARRKYETLSGPQASVDFGLPIAGSIGKRTASGVAEEPTGDAWRDASQPLGRGRPGPAGRTD